MFGTRRLAKRSIIGTKVCAPWTDGRYYAGIIQSTQNWPNGEEVYTVVFDDGRTKIIQDKDLIGPGFQGITSASLQQGQNLFLTYNGREVNGDVERHDTLTDDVYIAVSLPDEENVDVIRKLEDIRLIKSRKSARLLDQDTDYSRLADVHTEAKKRPVSHFIDVPFQKNDRGHGRHNSTQFPDEEEEVMELDDDEKREMMDDHFAAMVLTRLSCSPASPSFPVSIGHGSGTSPCGGSSYGSSGVWGMKGSPSNHSPPSQLSSSAPVGSSLLGTSPIDEGIDFDETDEYLSDEATPRKKRASVRTVFKCTWPVCGQIYNTVSGVERHVRIEHLGPKEEDEDLSDLSDHEEEFYYTEIEMTVDTMTQTFADMHTSSPPPTSYMEATGSLPDHDYQKKSIPIIGPSHHKTEAPQLGSSYPGTVSNNTQNIPRSSSWQPGGLAKVTKSDPNRAHSFASTVKNSPLHKKSRNEVKKCRKVYGMENRDMWCTQCKWKKACTRFRDQR